MTGTHTTATKTAGATPGTAAQPGPEVGIEADLALEVTGPHGHTNAQVYGSGRRLLLRADRPDVLLAAAAGPARAGVLDMLAQAEVAVELRGPRGRLLSVDPQRRSRVGALLWGSPHVRVDPSGWATIVRAAAPRARRSATRPPAVVPTWSRWRRSPVPRRPSRRRSLRRRSPGRGCVAGVASAPEVSTVADVRRLPTPVTEVWEWQTRAARRHVDSSVFFHPTRERGPAAAARDAAAKQICAGCPVIQACRRHALSVQEPYGVWGGLTTTERATVLRRRRSRRLRPVAT